MWFETNTHKLENAHAFTFVMWMALNYCHLFSTNCWHFRHKHRKKTKHWTSQKVIVGNNKYDLKRRTQILLNASFLFISALTPHFPRQKPSVSKMPSRVEKNLKTSHVLLIHLLQKQQVSWALCWELFLLFPRSRVSLNIY